MPSESTIFHKILAKEIPADVVFEDGTVLAFRDIRPKAATHILFIPKQFVASIADFTAETADACFCAVEPAGAAKAGGICMGGAIAGVVRKLGPDSAPPETVVNFKCQK